jgi:hypothetical protein
MTTLMADQERQASTEVGSHVYDGSSQTHIKNPVLTIQHWSIKCLWHPNCKHILNCIFCPPNTL